MVLSRAQSAEALNHVLFQVFDLPDDAPLVLSIKEEEGINDIHDFASLTRSDIESLFHTPEGGSVKSVPPHQRRLAAAFCDHIVH